jgi:hypothetical protein
MMWWSSISKRLVWKGSLGEKRNSKQGADVPAESLGTPPLAIDAGIAMTRKVGGSLEEVEG